MKNDDQSSINQNILFYRGDKSKNFKPKLISADYAVELRANYAKQKVKFQTANKKDILSFIISSDALNVLNKIATDEGRDFKGIALTPGYVNSGDNQGHTFIVSAIGSIKEDDVLDNSQSNQDFVHVLPIDYETASHLYDHLDICPDMCPKNKDRLTMTRIGNDFPWTRGPIKP